MVITDDPVFVEVITCPAGRDQDGIAPGQGAGSRPAQGQPGGQGIRDATVERKMVSYVLLYFLSKKISSSGISIVESE
jgi:hypothetical protein